MNHRSGRSPPAGTMLNDAGGKGPWSGGSGGDGGKDGGGGDGGAGGGGLGPRSPWSQPPRKRPPGGKGPDMPSALDELLRRGRDRFGGNFPGAGANTKLGLWAVLGVVLLWIIGTSFHQIGPQQRGVVTRLGSYAGTLKPGLRFTFPAPIDQVAKVNVDDIRTVDIGSTADNAQNLMLTGDQNIIDLAYTVRWNIRDPELYLFAIADVDDTIGQVAESAMRSEVAEVTLTQAMGAQRGAIEDRVAGRIQDILDGYHAGIQIQGVAIKQADPPAAVNDAFKEVSAAKQNAETYRNQAQAYAQQLEAKSQGEAAAFDKVYDQYRLAPEVTRQRMYYETMEDVLAKTDKVVIEAPGVNSYLPLPQLKQSTPAAPAAEAQPR